MTGLQKLSGFKSQAAYDKALSIAKDAEKYFPPKDSSKGWPYTQECVDVCADYLVIGPNSSVCGVVDVFIDGYQFSVDIRGTSVKVRVCMHDINNGDGKVLFDIDADELVIKGKSVPVHLVSAAFYLMDANIWQGFD